MRNKIKIAVIGLASMYTFTGCVTSGLEYKQYGVGSPSQVGYSDFQIKENQWKVTYTGAMDSNPQLTMQHMYKRGRELCLEKGFKDFDIVNENQTEKNNGSQYVGYGRNLSNNQPISSCTVICK